MADAPRVFISYSHDSDQHADRVLALADALCDRGVEVILDRYVHPAPEEGWPRWMDTHIDKANFVLMVCTETYRRRVLGEEAPGQGTGVHWEGTLIYNRIAYGEPAARGSSQSSCPARSLRHIPDPVRGHNHYWVATFDLSDPGYEALYRHLTGQPTTPRPDLGPLQILPPIPRPRPVPGLLPLSGSLSSDLFVGIDDLLLLDLYTESRDNAIVLHVKCGFSHKPLTVSRPLTAPVACGCTMALLILRVEAPLVVSDRFDSQQIPDNAEITSLLLGARPRVSLKIRRGSRFLNGTGTFVLELHSQASPESSTERKQLRTITRPNRKSSETLSTQGSSVGLVRLHPEYFQIDWLHDHEQGRSEELYGLRKDASILLTALLHKAQRSRNLSCLIPDPEHPVPSGRTTSLKARLAKYFRFMRRTIR